MGGDSGGVFLFELRYVMGFRNTGFYGLFYLFICFYLFIFHAFRVLVILCFGF